MYVRTHASDLGRIGSTLKQQKHYVHVVVVHGNSKGRFFVLHCYMFDPIQL
jgi:hypothetical protein